MIYLYVAYTRLRRIITFNHLKHTVFSKFVDFFSTIFDFLFRREVFVRPVSTWPVRLNGRCETCWMDTNVFVSSRGLPRKERTFPIYMLPCLMTCLVGSKLQVYAGVRFDTITIPSILLTHLCSLFRYLSIIFTFPSDFPFTYIHLQSCQI